jgi:hypothetical protein
MAPTLMTLPKEILREICIEVAGVYSSLRTAVPVGEPGRRKIQPSFLFLGSYKTPLKMMYTCKTLYRELLNILYSYQVFKITIQDRAI